MMVVVMTSNSSRVPVSDTFIGNGDGRTVNERATQTSKYPTRSRAIAAEVVASTTYNDGASRSIVSDAYDRINEDEIDANTLEFAENRSASVRRLRTASARLYSMADVVEENVVKMEGVTHMAGAAGPIDILLKSGNDIDQILNMTVQVNTDNDLPLLEQFVPRGNDELVSKLATSDTNISDLHTQLSVSSTTLERMCMSNIVKYSRGIKLMSAATPTDYLTSRTSPSLSISEAAPMYVLSLDWPGVAWSPAPLRTAVTQARKENKDILTVDPDKRLLYLWDPPRYKFDVTAVVFHPHVLDMIIVGFGACDSRLNGGDEGYLCAFSLQNQVVPDRVYMLDKAVTAVAVHPLYVCDMYHRLCYY